MVYPHQFPLQQPSPRMHFLPNTNFPHPHQMQGYMVSAIFWDPIKGPDVSESVRVHKVKPEV